jgi:uncharacterized protein (TIGR02996 family)
MSPDDAFLADIIANPDDDNLRLIYADYLDERGDPRGEFIRVQIELARLAPGQDVDSRRGFVEGGTLSTANRVECVLAQVTAERAGLAHGRYPELKRREADLLDAHGERWAEPVRPFVLHDACVPSRMFRRGFIERVQVEPVVLVEHGAVLFRQAPIVDVTLGGSFEADEPIAEALALPALGRLNALGVCGFDVPGPVLAALADARHLSRLSWLALQVELGDAEAQTLANLPHLASLTDLHLEENNIGPYGVAALAASPHLGRLAGLYLGWNPVGNEGLAYLGASPLLDRLTTLDLGWCHIGDSPEVVALLESPCLAGLTTLYLADNFRLQPAEVQALARSPHLRRLTTLDLFKVPLDQGSVRALATSPGLSHLTTLNLGLNFREAEGTAAAEVLAAAPSLGHLAALNSCNNGVGPAGTVALASSPHLANLVLLDLSYNDIGTAGALALARSTTLTALTEVILRGVTIGPEGVEALRQRFGEGLML